MIEFEDIFILLCATFGWVIGTLLTKIAIVFLPAKLKEKQIIGYYLYIFSIIIICKCIYYGGWFGYKIFNYERKKEIIRKKIVIINIDKNK
jgi:hypothetical protein